MAWKIFALALLCGHPSFAAPEPDFVVHERASTRSERRLGFLVGLNDPVPALFGINAAVNVLDFLRITAGVGRFDSTVKMQGFAMTTKSVTWGVGARLLLPGRDLTPVLGASWATIATDGFPNESRHVYFAAGIEWQTRFGLNLGAGYNQSTDAQIGGLPYLNVGWYLGVP